MQSVQQASYSYPDTGYRDILAMQRPSITSANLNAGEISPHLDIPSASAISHGTQPHEQQSFAYFLDGGCNAAASASSSDDKTAVRLQAGIMTETHPHQMGRLSSDLLSDFQFPTHEPALYPGFTPGWSFPSA
jgi:hypothetical protein